MSDSLPPLTALRAFDAAARHMSFAKAAEELHVTPAALSVQIKSLESHLGASVFKRLNRAVELTELGRTLLPGTRDGFAALRAAWSTARRQLDTSSLTVTAGPAFTAKWLAPRLFDFVRNHPEIELRFSASLRRVDLNREDVDVAIRFGTITGDAGLFYKTIEGDFATPMMTPQLAARFISPSDLYNAPLLYHDDVRLFDAPLDWPAWFQAAGLVDPPPAGTVFNQADHAIDAALSGGGVMLGRIVLAEKDLREGRLVAPFDFALSTRARYRFVCAEAQRERPQVLAFLRWLEQEMARSRYPLDRFKIVPVESLDLESPTRGRTQR